MCEKLLGSLHVRPGKAKVRIALLQVDGLGMLLAPCLGIASCHVIDPHHGVPVGVPGDGDISPAQPALQVRGFGIGAPASACRTPW
ncbi:hypothetical protein [Pseudarthrobacter sp. NamE5]|uniref:hypothetical protein n=1 Tax=Pseudarthrobacter sp. NamE5 TaxID=2576839 RepID=UPI00116870BE|nr:hypothetical protein [Pseudarthrobacter sp. NamE5]TLM86013.1 hypothetical protein FDW84_06975 [Pseudarthrobacter sp. NamE5]